MQIFINFTLNLCYVTSVTNAQKRDNVVQKFYFFLVLRYIQKYDVKKESTLS